MHYFATLFDINYLSRGLAMMHSLHKSNKDVSFFVLCLDEESDRYLQQHPQDFQIQTIDLIEIESHFPDLLMVKTNRTYVEYLFTLSPFLPLYLLEKYPKVSRITSLDADMYFFSDPIPVMKECGEHAILITPHYFPKRVEELVAHGTYNVCFQSFPNTQNGFNCLKQWAKDCISFCGDYIDEQGRYADQKYLDSWTETFEYIVPLPFKGFGTAPWNVCANDLKYQKGQFLINSTPLIAYHFHNFRLINRLSFMHGLHDYNLLGLNKAVKKMYTLYFKKLLIYKPLHLKSEKITRYQISNQTLYGIPLQWYKVPFGLQIFGRMAYLDLRKYLYRFTVKQNAK